MRSRRACRRIYTEALIAQRHFIWIVAMPVALRRDRLKAAENSTPSAVLRSPKNIASYTRGYKSAIAALKRGRGGEWPFGRLNIRSLA